MPGVFLLRCLQWPLIYIDVGGSSAERGVTAWGGKVDSVGGLFVGLQSASVNDKRSCPPDYPTGAAIARQPTGGPFLCVGGKLAGMKLQFSLATLLVCTTVLGPVCAVAVSIPVYERITMAHFLAASNSAILTATIVTSPLPRALVDITRPPTPLEVAIRLA
jgi:hypothetical protein